jgi:hypothetical protein
MCDKPLLVIVVIGVVYAVVNNMSLYAVWYNSVMINLTNRITSGVIFWQLNVCFL